MKSSDEGDVFGNAAAPYPVCVDSGQDGADTHVRQRIWESRREAPPDVTPSADARYSPIRRPGAASRSLQQPGTCALPVPSTSLHEPAQQAHLQVSTEDSGTVCQLLPLCCLFLYTTRRNQAHSALYSQKTLP